MKYTKKTLKISLNLISHRMLFLKDDSSSVNVFFDLNTEELLPQESLFKRVIPTQIQALIHC